VPFLESVSEELKRQRETEYKTPRVIGTYDLLFAIVLGYLCRLEPPGASLRDGRLARLRLRIAEEGVGSFRLDTAVMSSTQKSRV
jgi:hypothetical protein